ncbi:MAG TPA: metal-dependent hydrolase [Pseudomonadales bacterium]|nr:metal-dependent hydrolase [Pseudomonadales bacterium]
MNTAVSSAQVEGLSKRMVAKGIKVRPMEFEFEQTPEFWYNNDPFLTIFLTALSATFPDGEKQFIHSVRHFENQITDPQLKAQIKAFIGQEAHHSKQHDGLNNFMKRKGYAVETVEIGMKKMAKYMRTKLSPKVQLANTVSAEHITAIMADYFMRLDPQQLKNLHESVRRVWAWHAIEETEHKAVAFDVFKQTVNDDGLRRFNMALTTVLFVLHTNISMLQLMPQTGHMGDLKMWFKGLNFFWGPSGMVWKILPQYLAFYKRDFHPNQLDNSAAVEATKREYQID